MPIRIPQFIPPAPFSRKGPTLNWQPNPPPLPLQFQSVRVRFPVGSPDSSGCTIAPPDLTSGGSFAPPLPGREPRFPISRASVPGPLSRPFCHKALLGFL
ncbi:hypothetical protein FKP32DRAFT_1589026 [Trametes sanguinea]|nr:hypothetical protein FKP32DRAFT_1589026 [Trametes sanguinea]